MIQGIKSTLSIFAALVVGIICPSVSSGMDLWAFSCFSYEDASGKLRKLFHRTQHVEMQVDYAFFSLTEMCN